MKSTVERLEGILSSVADRLAKLIMVLKPIWQPKDHGPVVFICPDYRWPALSAEQHAERIEILRTYEPASEIANQLMQRVPDDLRHRQASADQAIRKWIDFHENWSLTARLDANEAAMRASVDEAVAILKLLKNVGDQGTVLIPDTNALLKECDPTKYRAITDQLPFTFLLLPTVLAELDKLKVEHRNADIRDKAEAAVRRIKGWRNQGSLRTGVTVDKTITVRADHIEPNMESTLSWLDRTNADDRVVANVVAIQAAHPAARVVLVTHDINLQNKADAALIEVAEL